MKIGSGIPQTGALRFKNKQTRIDNYKAEINRIVQLMMNGDISEDEAKMRISALEAQIERLENSSPTGGDTDVELDPNKVIAPVGATEAQIGLQNGSEGITNNEPVFGKDDIYSYEATVNKALHGLN